MDIQNAPMINDTRPFTRWWWFSGPLTLEEIDYQLDWLVKKGFGGVEIAWVYPLTGTKADDGPKFLDNEFIGYVTYAIEGCKSRGLGCDLTYGTLWPFNGTFIPPEHAGKTLSGSSSQRVDRSWEVRYSNLPAKILDHLDPKSLKWYTHYLETHQFTQLAQIAPMSFFCDSWEVNPEDLGYKGVFEDFLHTYGYDLAPYAKGLNNHADIRFDYRHLISRCILEAFYRPFVELCHEAGALARVQCHGAPTDILAAYALCDIPETETLLFDPDFALLAASAAALTNKPIVSSETFSCIYGWVPTPQVPHGIGEELVDDLRCVADAQFAWGVNRVIWHGKPFSTPEHPNRFYASVHVGSDSNLDPHFASFNTYLSTVSDFMGRGGTISNLAVLLPLEDQWIKDRLPSELLKPSSNWYWELQELHIDEQLMPYRPLWFSSTWLKEVRFANGKLIYKDRDIGALYCDSKWMLFSSVQKLAALMESGAPIIFNRWPTEPGKIQHPDYKQLIERMQDLAVHSLYDIRPVVTASEPLDYWCRKDGDILYLFFAHPQMRKLRYPLLYGYAKSMKEQVVNAIVYAPNGNIFLELNFDKHESLLFEIDESNRVVKQILLPVIM